MSQFIGTANQGYSPYAIEELRRLLPGVSFQGLSAGEVFLMDSPLDCEATVSAIHGQEPVFLRHIQAVDSIIDLQGDVSDLERLAQMIQEEGGRLTNKRAAIHVRKAPKTAYAFTPAETKAAVDPIMIELGAKPSQQQPDIIIAVYAAENKLYIGLGTPADMLSDWPGGAIRFQREEGQISRAKFKLLEAERAFGLDYEGYRNALDIGAAPGGWTSLLLERGLRVTAVDPANLHPSIAKHPRLTYMKRNASEVSFKPSSFDLFVCDMSWSPMLMSKLVLELKDALAPGATAIITIKLMHRKPLQTIREVIARLGEAFMLCKAKQLFHNREEITLFLQKK